MNYTATDIEALVARAHAADLEGVELLSADPATLAAQYNGIGPESWPEAVRDVVTRFFSLFAPAALIHDLRYSSGDGSRFDYNFANIEFHNNCLRLARHEIAWWRFLRRASAETAALTFYRAVASSFGWNAYLSATLKKQKGE